MSVNASLTNTAENGSLMNQTEVTRLQNQFPESKVWNSYLYQLQQQAPVPKPIRFPVPHHLYGMTHHGCISCDKASKLLVADGNYLVRESEGAQGFSTLSLRSLGKLKHFRLYYDGQHYVGEKKFNSLTDLVADGLVTMYLEAKAGDYISLMSNVAVYEESPYVTLNRRKRSTLKSSQQMNSAPESHVDSKSEFHQNMTTDTDYVKAHSFQIHTFKGLTWCDLCSNFMWGIISQGVRCDDCGFSAHRRCSEKVPNDCCPDLKHIRGIFGVDLTTLVKAHRTVRPFVVDKCIEQIELRGMNVEGLYRVSGSVEEIETLKLAFDRDGEQADLTSSVCEDVHAISGILKLFFRLLPIPLITFDVYPKLIAAIRGREPPGNIHDVFKVLMTLPPAHYNTLKYTIQHLARVVSMRHINKMTAYNLSTVFAPTLLPTPDMHNQQGLPEMKNESMLIEFLIDHCGTIFGIKSL